MGGKKLQVGGEVGGAVKVAIGDGFPVVVVEGFGEVDGWEWQRQNSENLKCYFKNSAKI